VADPVLTTDLDLDAPDTVADPHAALRALRERAPMAWSERHRAWLLVGYAETAEAFRDPRLSSERIPAFQRLADRHGEGFQVVVDLLRGWMVFRDPPDHTRLRDPLRRVFTPRVVERMEPFIDGFCAALLDELADAGACELRAAYAQPLPALVIAELLGVPGGDRQRFQAWSDELTAAVFQMESRQVDAARAIAAAGQFSEFFRDLIAHYQRHPADNLISLLIEASRGGDGLGRDELVGACAMLLFAGHETTTGLITNALRVLLERPEQAARLRGDPGLDATAVDELLRFEGPAKTMVRRVISPHERGGEKLAAGDRVFLCILGADRDPAVFHDPDTLDLGRRPNPHLAFGWGLHHCLGAPLARLETRIALRRLLDRYPELAAQELPAWVGGALGRITPTLPVQLGSRRG
jgi:cytochrome P450